MNSSSSGNEAAVQPHAGADDRHVSSGMERASSLDANAHAVVGIRNEADVRTKHSDTAEATRQLRELNGGGKAVASSSRAEEGKEQPVLEFSEPSNGVAAANGDEDSSTED